MWQALSRAAVNACGVNLIEGLAIEGALAKRLVGGPLVNRAFALHFQKAEEFQCGHTGFPRPLPAEMCVADLLFLQPRSVRSFLIFIANLTGPGGKGPAWCPVFQP